jgi:hypothetical protein
MIHNKIYLSHERNLTALELVQRIGTSTMFTDCIAVICVWNLCPVSKEVDEFINEIKKL